MSHRIYLTIVALAAIVTIAGCGRLNRAATINQVTTTPGAAIAATLQQHLADEFPNARVTCAHSMIVRVGTRTACNVTEAGANRTVRFTFSTTHGAIDPASVKATS
jgi:hypothetical protein